MSQPLHFAKHGYHIKARYGELSKQPLYILVFLSPLVVFYEIALYLAKHNIQIKAHDHLVSFFEQFDMPPTEGLWLGGIAVLTILLLWHIFSDNKWSIQLRVVSFMALESVVLAVPLLLFGAVLGGLAAAASSTAIGDLELFEKLAVSIGAGLYEELLFRMILIAFVHTVVCNILKQSNLLGLGLGIVSSAILFSLYHDLPDVGTLPASSLFFFGVAGIYLGVIYVSRGFGIAAATHAAYDVVATTILASIAS